MYAIGLYKCRILEHCISEANSGSLQVVLTFKVLEPEDGHVPAEWQQYERTLFWSLHDNSWKYTKVKLQRIGWDEAGGLGPINEGGALVGQEAIFECGRNSYQGKTREDWDLPAEGKQHGSVTMEAVKDLENRLGMLVAPEPPKAKEAGPVKQGDIPF